jgi:hypothetical protein
LDYSAIVNTVLGTEGAPRYKRLGVILIIISILLIVSILALPIFTASYDTPGGNVEEESWTYFQMRDDRMLWESFLGQIHTSLIGLLLLMVLGVVLLLEGLGTISLKKLLPWRTEVTANTLYVLAAIFAFLGVMGMASIWGLTLHPEEWTYNMEEYSENLSSSAGILVTVLGMVVLLCLLALVAYQVILVAYRNGLDPKARSMGKLAVLLVLVSMLGIIALRLGSIVVVDYSVDYGFPGGGGAYDGTDRYTFLETDLMAHVPDAPSSLERLDLYLDIASWCLLISTIIGLMAILGITSYGLGGRRRLVYLSMAFPVIIVILGLVALITILVAFGLLQDAATDIMGGNFYPYGESQANGSAGSGLFIGLLLCIVVGIVSIVNVRFIGRSIIKMALGTVPVPVAEEVPPVEHVPPGLAAETVSAGGEPEKAPTFHLTRKGVIWLALIAIIGVAASSGAYWYIGQRDTAGNGDVGTSVVDIDSLEDFSASFLEGSYLDEGEWNTCWISEEITSDHGDDSSTLFIDSIYVTVTWVDEDDQQNPIATYENQPDRFGLDLYDEEYSYVNDNVEGENTHGNPGVLELYWSASDYYIGWGNESVEVSNPNEVVWGTWVFADVYMISAGNKEAPRRPIAYTDNGNDFEIEIWVTGKIYTP